MSSRLTTARALGAFALANARYWLTVAGQARAQMRHWEARAQAIEDPGLRALALEKLREEGFNAEAAAMAATIAPRAAREHAVRAIVALELMFDLLDGLTERPHEDPLGEGERLYAVFVAALDPHAKPTERPCTLEARTEAETRRFDAREAATEPLAQRRDAQFAEGYLHELGETVREAISQLPAHEAIAPVASLCAARGAQAQIRMHAAPLLGTRQLGDWARGEAHGTALGWREFLAGSACSVLALHALVGAAADPRTTAADARAIEATYLFTGAMVTLLDGVIDREHDTATGALSYIALYENPALLAQALAQAAREAARRSAELRNGAHHLMTLAGAMAYWCSTPSARGEHVKPLLSELRRELRPLALLPLLLMRAWRASRKVPGHRRTASTEAQSLLSC